VVHFATAGCVALLRSLDFGSDDAFVVMQAKASAALSLRVWLPCRRVVPWLGEARERACGGVCMPKENVVHVNPVQTSWFWLRGFPRKFERRWGQ